MNKYMLVIPCLIAMSGCQPQETKTSAGAAASAVSAAPVPVVAAVPVKKDSPVVITRSQRR